MARAFKFFEITCELRFALAEIVHQQPNKHSHYSVNHRHGAGFDVLTEFHPIGAEKADEIRQNRPPRSCAPKPSLNAASSTGSNIRA